MINQVPSDDDVERWFARHPGDAAALSDNKLRPIAAWFPMIGIPAND